MIDHRQIDLRSLAFDRLIRSKIEANPLVIEKARATIERWLISCAPNVRSTLIEWKQILEGPRDELMSMLTSTDERATRLRQSSPFAGVLTAAERTKIIQQYRTHEPASA